MGQGRGGRQRRAQGAEGGEFSVGAEVRTALIDGNTFRRKAVQYLVFEGLAIVEGDIVIGTEQEVAQATEQAKSVAAAEARGEIAAGVIRTGAQYRWPNCTVPYTIDSSLPNQSRVTDAIAHWEANTGFRFVVRTSEADYVTFRPAGGCSSSVGKRGGQQFVNLASGCSTGNTIHEIGHVVGMWHEQSREDRDSFVTIHWDKIISGLESNFSQHIADGDDVGAYDYGSIMHYPRTAFSVDGSDTITPVDPAAQIGQRTALSAGDIATAQALCGPRIVPPIGTLKEAIKDIRFDTRKEAIRDTLKELIKDRIKDVAYDPPWRKPPFDIGPRPLPWRITPRLRPGGRLPFAVATAHQAPAAAADAGQIEATVADLDAQLEALAEQLAQVESSREMLQAQYDETAELLQQAVEAHEQASASEADRA